MGVLYVSGEKPAVTVGRDPGCDLVLDSFVVSRKHLIFLYVTCDVASVEVLGTNGAVVSGKKVNRGYRGYVRAGDVVRIGDAKIVWTGKYEPCKAFVKGLASLPLPDLTPVEIEGPPPRKVPEKPSVMLAAGPALTMAIPMLLGVGRSVAVLSSVFAALFAAANVLSRVRKQKAEEKRRRSSYIAYLKECEEYIRSRQGDIKEKLCSIYPGVEKYFNGGYDPFILWKQSAAEGVIKARIGKGVISSPLLISAPKERFAATADSLRELPLCICKKYENITSCPVLGILEPKTIAAFVVENNADLQTLSSYILQIAVSYPPDEVRIMIQASDALTDHLSWIAYLPHYEADKEIPAAVLVTDDETVAYENHAKNIRIIYIVRSFGDVPRGFAVLNRRSGMMVKMDKIARQLCFSYAGLMSGLWNIGADNSEIPESVGFSKLFDVPSSRDVFSLASMIEENYRKSDTTEHIAAPVGMCSKDEKLMLDLHEKGAGPHGLIAGTTGSGKSELLTTLILSFSALFPPDKLAFFLIDYKGGGMSNMFEKLPHVIGSISNLSGSSTMRAMISLRAENIRRQEIFAKAHVNNINDYTRLYVNSPDMEPLPHILIIVDEFAELRTQEPEFMDRLISISQVGRSLGMHLILATQKPSGVIDDRIRSNARFRIALRLVDRSDSMDMLASSAAADLKVCGRAWFQVGNNEVFECFQSGYAMETVSASGGKLSVYEDAFCRREAKLCECDEEYTEGPTWYELFLEAIIAADRSFCGRKSARLWLPLLPSVIEDDDAFAVYDDPYRQKYVKAAYDPLSAGNVLITGRSGSGKSELVYTMLSHLHGEVPFYIIDRGGGVLKGLKGYKCCGGYVTDDTDDMIRLMMFLCDEIGERRKSHSKCQPVVLAVDGYTEMIKEAGQPAAEYMNKILSMGMSANVSVIVTSIKEAESGLLSLFDTVLLLGRSDRYVAANMLRVASGDIPAIEDIPGRGIGLCGKVPLEFQAVKTDKVSEKPPDGCTNAVHFPYVPRQPSLEDLLERVMLHPPDNEDVRAAFPAGYIKKSGRIYNIPFKKLRCVLVGGKPFGGRHTFLFNISLIAARFSIPCVRADTAEALISVCRSVTEFTIVTITSITEFLDEYYAAERGRPDEDELASYFENRIYVSGRDECRYVIIGVIENEARSRFSGRKIFESMTKHMYGLSFGGSLHENRIFDFSYMPFAEIQKSQMRHFATILKFDENTFSGDVITTGKIIVDNSQSK